MILVLRRALPGACIATAVALAGACSSGSSHPPALGQCSGTTQTACSTYGGGGGGGGGGGSKDSGAAQDSGNSASDDAGACGTAGSLLNTLNNQCLPCVAASCCLSGLACTGECLSLVQCSGSINTCESQFPAGITPYNDFAHCLSQSCPTQCPTLPQATAGDF
jgi:hypothetical protein